MDYSLLFVVAFNPKYVEQHPDEFDVGKKGEYVLKKPELNPEANKVKGKKTAKAYKRQTDEFLQKMTGYEKNEYDRYTRELKEKVKDLGIQDAKFDYKKMKNPYQDKDIRYNLQTC